MYLFYGHNTAVCITVCEVVLVHSFVSSLHVVFCLRVSHHLQKVVECLKVPRTSANLATAIGVLSMLRFCASWAFHLAVHQLGV